jgi:PHD/YefM family antitoxin component YafN of YafNO toxin-antitoxin module
MKTTSITRLRTDTTKLVAELRSGADEPVLILQGSEIAGYLVSSKLWDRLMADLKRLRQRNRELFWEGVEEAEREVARGETTTYTTADELIAALGLATDDDERHDAA